MSLQPENRSVPRRLAVRRRWLEWPAPRTEPRLDVDLIVAGRRIWSGRTQRPNPRVQRVVWPRALRPYLRGSGDIEVRSPGGAVLAAGRYAFGDAGAGGGLSSIGAAALVVDKWGKLATAPSEGLHLLLLRELDSVVAQLQRAGYAVSITGGTLLGAVRAGNILERDDDADLVVYLGEAGPADVSLASYGVQRALEAAGRQVIRHSDAHLQLPLEGGANRAHVDVFLGFHHAGTYHQPIAVLGNLPVDAILPLGTVRLSDRSFPAVADPERWLELCYGPAWRTPDPAFRFRTPVSTRRRFENWFGVYDLNRHFWEDWLARSPWSWPVDARRFSELLPPGARIIDVGAGTGINARVLAERGHRVLAVDYALTAVETAERRSAHTFEVRRVNAADRRDLIGLAADELAAGSAPNVLLSDVLAYVTRSTRANIFRFLQLVLGSEGRSLASFPVNPSLRYEHERPDSWHLPLDWLREEIRPFGLEFEVLGYGYRRTSAGVRRFASAMIRAGGGE